MKTFKLIIFILLISPICFGADWYVSPTGSDGANGTSDETPLATFAHAYTLMSPGDTLYLMDGTYNEQLYPPVALSGSSGSPTKFIAVNDSQAIIAPTIENYAADTRAAIYIYSNVSRGRMSYFDFEGLFAKAAGEHNGIGVYSMDFADPETQMTNHINFRRCGSMGGAVDRNVSSVELMGSTDILFEDGYAFGFGRKALEVYGAIRVTVRRTIVRFDWWEGDGYKPNDPRIGMTCYNTLDSTFENIISFDSGPRPIGSSPDMAAFVLSGNDAGGTGIQGSAGSGYYGSIAFNNKPGGYMNGFEINGGTGTAVTDLTVKDVVLIDNSGFGLNIHDNVNGVAISNLSTINNTLTGTRQNPYPVYGISNVTITTSLSKDNGGYGYYGVTPTNSSSTGNGSGGTVEPSYMPTILHPPTNTPVSGYDRGATIIFKYIDGIETAYPLWPWAGEAIIKDKMCNATYLQEIENAINGHDSSSIDYVPGWCATNKTLTEYVWEYLGNEIPADIYGDPPGRGHSRSDSSYI